MGNPKQALHSFLQRYKCPLPTYDVSDVQGGGFLCTMTCPAVKSAAYSLDERAYRAVGANKKAAQQASAEAALAFVQKTPLFMPSATEETLLNVLESLLTDDGLRRDIGMEGQVLLAQRANEGWMPVHIPGHARTVRNWYLANEPELGKDFGKTCKHLQHQLKANGKAGGGFEVDESRGSHWIRRKAEYMGRTQGKTQAAAALWASVQLTEGKSFASIRIPADTGLGMEEVAIEGGGYYWQRVAAVLMPGASPEALTAALPSVLFWDKVGHPARVPVPRGAPTSDGDDRLLELMTKHLGPMPRGPHAQIDGHAEGASGLESPRCGKKRKQPPGAEPAGPANPAVSSHEAHLRDIAAPTMYTLNCAADGASLNLRASWLARRRVHGEAVLTYVRLRPSEWGTPALRTGQLTRAYFGAWAAAQLPSAEYALGRSMPLATRLPHIYRTLKAWHGPEPSELLAAALPADLLVNGIPQYDNATRSATADNLDTHAAGLDDAATTDASEEEEPASGHEATVSLSILGGSFCAPSPSAAALAGQGGTVRVALAPPAAAQRSQCSSGVCVGSAAAHQNAALAALHCLDAFLRLLLLPATPAQPVVPPSAPCVPADDLLQVVRAGNAWGAAAWPVAGAAARLNYSIATEAGVVEAGRGVRAELGTGTLAPEVEAAVGVLGLGGLACAVIRPAAGPAVCGLQAWARQWGATVLLEVELCSWKPPASSASTAQRLFDPSLSQQRHEFVGRVLREAGAASVVDLGCGDAKLLDFLIRQHAAHSQVRRLVGVDHKPELLRRGARRLAKAAAALAGQAWEAKPGVAAGATGRLPATELVQASIADEAALTPEGWGSAYAPDAAVLMEVLEHLDAGPLGRLGPAVLGALQPRLLVVTTPNRAYNPVLRALGSALLPNLLRNSDHRFEWDSQEFQAWAQGQAQRYAYEVRFGGIGRCMDEARALIALRTPHERPGSATQVAIFTRMDCSTTSAQPMET